MGSTPLLPSSSLEDLGRWTAIIWNIAGDSPHGKENVAKHELAGTHHPIQISPAKAEFNGMGKYNPFSGREVELGKQ